ncbi:MAG: TadE/TadG family protein [Rhodopseudomonas sp.]|nr:pilus assembly protein [Rhodopseudomonas sp.]NVN86676.1 TadE/TadG family protein [Rhodopseudomonas sp.]
MSVASILARLRKSADGFGRANDGNIAVIFAIALLPILTFIGAAIDYSRANSARTSMQAALDSAALMVSKDDSAGNLSAASLTSKAQAYFNALYNNTEVTGVNVTASYSNTAAAGARIVLTASGTIATDFMKIAGMPTMNFGTTSTTAWGTTKLRVALALDNTGSMADDGKITALITASKNLIDQLSASAAVNGDVYISVVPFANVVNIGTSFVNSGYIDWSQWSTHGSIEENYSCGSSNQAPSWQNGYNGTMKCGTANNSTNNWNGCVMDRGTSTPPGTASGPDVLITPPTTAANYYPADQSSYCPTVISPLSYNWSNLKSSIDAMTPSGGTNQPVGLVWAWQTLQQSAPFNAPAEDPNYTYKKAIILLSDGLNTMDRWYGTGSSWSSNVDDRQKLLCDNIKAAGVTLYTIQVNTGGDPTSSVLQYCASSTSNFFMLTSASQVISTFNSIGTSLSKLRIAK